MAEFRTLARVDEIPPGKAREFTVGEIPVAIFHAEGEFYAIRNRCTHAEVPLHDGWVDGKCVACPWHGAQFDLQTGEALSGPAVLATETFPLEVVDDEIRVAI